MAHGDGTVFSIPVTGGTPTTLYSFDGAHGQYPAGDLTLSGSTLYGTTCLGGANGYGTVFALTIAEPGDANGDGKVDINDLTIVLTNFGQSGMTWSQGDFNTDGKVDINDLTIVLTNFGQTAARASRPYQSRHAWSCLPHRRPARLWLAKAITLGCNAVYCENNWCGNNEISSPAAMIMMVEDAAHHGRLARAPIGADATLPLAPRSPWWNSWWSSRSSAF